MATQSKAWVCGCSLAGIEGSDLAGVHESHSLECVVCCHVEVSASG
jgi:hypothetical protein